MLRRTHPGQQVVILTGRADEHARKMCLENGAALALAATRNYTQAVDEIQRAMRINPNWPRDGVPLDDLFGAEVAFPFSEGIVFEIGSYARAVGDIAGSTFANASVTAAQTVIFTSKAGVIRADSHSCQEGGNTV